MNRRLRSIPEGHDLFCGAGGTTTGVIKAGAKIRVAMNHWQRAIETHNANHPGVDHLCADVSLYDPLRLPRGADFLVASPECKTFSKASGRQSDSSQLSMFGSRKLDPSVERSRATMWDVPRFAEVHDYRFIIVENVLRIQNWVMLEAWWKAMALLDYEWQIICFNSMFAWPTPQSRDRVYVVFHKRGVRKPQIDTSAFAPCLHCGKDVHALQTWKRPGNVWGEYNRQYYYACPECFRRVAPYVYPAATAIDWSLSSKRIGDEKFGPLGNKPLAANTLARVQAGIDRYWGDPFLVIQRQSDNGHGGDYGRTKSLLEPTATMTTVSSSHGLVTQVNRGMVVNAAGECYESGNYRRIWDAGERALPTQTATLAHGVVQPPEGFIRSYGPDTGLRHVDEPIPTVMSRDRFGLVQPPFIAEMHGNSTARPTDNALSTVTAGGRHHALITAHYRNSDDRRTGRPGGWSKDANEAPVGAITAADSHTLLEAPEGFLVPYHQRSNAVPVTTPMPTVWTTDGFALAEPGNYTPPAIEDCFFRMLEIPEVQAAMGFPPDYILMGTKTDQQRQLGNGVTPPVMEHRLVRPCLEVLD